MALELQAGTANAIRRHGAEHPNECCGALVGRDGVVFDVYPLPNTTEEGPRRRFRCGRRITARQNARLPRLGRSCSGFTIRIRIIPARPSQDDQDHAWPYFRTSSFRSAPACPKR